MSDCRYCSDKNNILASVFYYFVPWDTNNEVDIEPKDIKYCPICGRKLEDDESK